MLCTLVFIGYGHLFINGYGSWFYKACHYQCNTENIRRVYRVHPNIICPVRFYET